MNTVSVDSCLYEGGGRAFLGALLGKNSELGNLYGADVSVVQGVRRYASSWLHLSDSYQEWLLTGEGGLRERQVGIISAKQSDFVPDNPSASAIPSNPTPFYQSWESRQKGDNFLKELGALAAFKGIKLSEHNPRLVMALVMQFQGKTELIAEMLPLLTEYLAEEPHEYSALAKLTKEKRLELLLTTIFNFELLEKGDAGEHVLAIKQSMARLGQEFLVDALRINPTTRSMLDAIKCEMYFESMMVLCESIYYINRGVGFALSGANFLPLAVTVGLILHTIGPATAAMSAAWKAITEENKSFVDGGTAAFKAFKEANNSAFSDINSFYPYIQTFVNTFSVLGIWYMLDIAHKHYNLPVLVSGKILYMTLDLIILINMNLSKGASFTSIAKKMPLFALVGIMRGMVKTPFMPAKMPMLQGIAVDNVMTFMVTLFGAMIRSLFMPTQVEGLIPVKTPAEPKEEEDHLKKE